MPRGIYSCALKGSKPPRGRVSPDGFSKTFRPGSRHNQARDAPFVRSATILYLTLCRSPRNRGGGPRVLGRAARLIEGPPIAPRFAPLATLGRTGAERARRGRVRERRRSITIGNLKASCERRKETITLNGGSLGSWVDEERS